MPSPGHLERVLRVEAASPVLQPTSISSAKKRKRQDDSNIVDNSVWSLLSDASKRLFPLLGFSSRKDAAASKTGPSSLDEQENLRDAVPLAVEALKTSCLPHADRPNTTAAIAADDDPTSPAVKPDDEKEKNRVTFTFRSGNPNRSLPGVKSSTPGFDPATLPAVHEGVAPTHSPASINTASHTIRPGWNLIIKPLVTSSRRQALIKSTQGPIRSPRGRPVQGLIHRTQDPSPQSHSTQSQQPVAYYMNSPLGQRDSKINSGTAPVSPPQHASIMEGGLIDDLGLRSQPQVGRANDQPDRFGNGVSETEIREGLAGAVRERMARTQREWRAEGMGAFTEVPGRSNQSSNNGKDSNSKALVLADARPDGSLSSSHDVVLFNKGKPRDSAKPSAVERRWWERDSFRVDSVLSLLPAPKPSVTALSGSQRNRFQGARRFGVGGSSVPGWMGRAAECWSMGDRFASLMGSYGEEMRTKRARTMQEQMEAARMFQAAPEEEVLMLPPPVEHLTRSPLASKAQQQAEQEQEEDSGEENQANDAGRFKEAAGQWPSAQKPSATAADINVAPADVTASRNIGNEAAVVSVRSQPPAAHDVIIGRGESVRVSVISSRAEGERGADAASTRSGKTGDRQVKGSGETGVGAVIWGKGRVEAWSSGKESGPVRERGRKASAEVFVIPDDDDDDEGEEGAAATARREASGEVADGSADVVEKPLGGTSLDARTTSDMIVRGVTVTGVSVREGVKEVGKQVAEPPVSEMLSLKIRDAERELSERGERGEQMKTRREQRRASRAKDLVTAPAEPSVSPSLKPLSKEEEAVVTRALARTANRLEELVEHRGSNIIITRDNISCLRPGQWLNDEVINLYLSLVKEREKRRAEPGPVCHIFSTFFYGKLSSMGSGYNYSNVRRWTLPKKIGYHLSDCDKVIVPVHQGMHWVLAVIDIKQQMLTYYDSFDGADPQCLEYLARYLADELRDKQSKAVDTSGWQKRFLRRGSIPQQQNTWDCGVFMTMFADYEAQGRKVDFSQSNMDFFRRKMVRDILRLRVD